MQPYPDYLQRTGYRLPTEAEWEYACRAGTLTSRYYGHAEAMLEQYAWFVRNSQDHPWPVGTLKPNRLGLFDVHGNVWEWCQGSWKSYWEEGGPRFEDVEDTTIIDDETNRVLRGGSYDSLPTRLRSAYRDRHEKPYISAEDIGFRIARTLPD